MCTHNQHTVSKSHPEYNIYYPISKGIVFSACVVYGGLGTYFDLFV